MAEAPVRVLPVRPKALTVGEFNRQVKGTIEQSFPAVWIEGEIASCKIAASGHAYFDLKDDREEARVSCCLFKGSLSRARAAIRDGERVLVKGKASLYPARGSFQLIIDAVLPAGAGNAAAALEALKRRLAAEGLMAPERKRPLPRFPRAVGVVTALAGAAFADICRVIHRRWPARIVIANTLVQGAEAPARIVAALEAVQRVAGVDVVIVGRGGGAADDLVAFNDERVARAIAACCVPVISAVGHEVDHTVADLVADVRAATPSNAAELAVPEWRAVQADLAKLEERLANAARARVNARRLAHARLEKRLGDPRRLTAEAHQRLDDAHARLANAARRRLAAVRRGLDDAHRRLKGAHPRTRLARDRGALEKLAQRLGPAARRLLDARARLLADAAARLPVAARAAASARRGELATRAVALDALSPLAILARGYSVVLAQGRAVTRAVDVREGDALTVRLHDGELDARVTATRARADTDAAGGE